MLQLTFAAATRAGLLDEIRAFLAQEEAPAGQTQSGAAAQSGESDALVQRILARLREGGVARHVLVAWAQATLDGQVAKYADLVDRFAGGDTKRWAGNIQPITKACLACGLKPSEFFTWVSGPDGWKLTRESDARAVLDLLGAK